MYIFIWPIISSVTLSKALNLCIPLPARGKQWLLCYLRPAPEHAWNDPRGHNGQGFQETDAWDHWLLSPGSKLSPYSPGSRAEVLICPLTPMFCECRMNLRKASKPTLGRSLASWGQAHRRPGLHHTWEGRNLCYHDNSKVLKERGTPGIQPAWDAECSRGTRQPCPPELLGTGSTCWPGCHGIQRSSVQSKEQGWGKAPGQGSS